jgi:uncharacterized damage-inducible protein DinB
MVEDIDDPRRSEPAYLLDERAMLEAWLEFHRLTLLLKCEGLDDAGRKVRPIPTSKMSLHGLVRHMAEVERGWFRRVLLSEPDLARIYCIDRLDDRDFDLVDDADWETDKATWEAECQAARDNAVERDLDTTGTHRSGDPVSLRWIYVHMIEEYARHNGHADLIRELVDGSVGW